MPALLDEGDGDSESESPDESENDYNEEILVDSEPGHDDDDHTKTKKSHKAMQTHPNLFQHGPFSVTYREDKGVPSGWVAYCP